MLGRSVQVAVAGVGPVVYVLAHLVSLGQQQAIQLL